MSRKKITKKTPTTKKAPTKRITRERDPIPWKYCLLTLVCGLFLVIGFFGAARQHFSSIDLGIQNSKLRKQIEELESEQRRLLLSKEIVMSPSEIKKTAKKLGFTEMSASNIEVYRNPDSKPSAKDTTDAQKAKEPSNSKIGNKAKTPTESEAKKKEKTSDNKEKPKPQQAKK